MELTVNNLCTFLFNPLSHALGIRGLMHVHKCRPRLHRLIRDDTLCIERLFLWTENEKFYKTGKCRP